MAEVNTSIRKGFNFSHLWPLVKETYKQWTSHDPFQLAAAVAYYAVLSLPALLVIIINTVGAIWGNDIVQGRLHDEFSLALGEEAASGIEEMITNTQQGDKSTVSTIIGIATLLFGATGVFYQLQMSLNRIWRIKQSDDAGILKLVLDRARGFGFVLVIGFLLLISFVLTAGLSLLSDYILQIFPDYMLYLMKVVNSVLSLAIISALFALMFKYLPDAKIQWRTVWVGGIITSVLFGIGKFLLGFYFGEAEPGSTYGAAGSVVLVLLWVSYSALILFFGAQFTYVYAKRYGHTIEPNDYAVRYIQKIKEVPKPESKEEKTSSCESEK